MSQESKSFQEGLKQLAISNPEIDSFLKDLEKSLVGKEKPSNNGEEEPSDDKAEFSIGGAEGLVLAILFFFATYVLFRWAKDTLDNQRAMDETSVAERRISIIQSLITLGLDAETAEGITTRCLGVIANRTKDDPVLDTILTTAQKYLPETSDEDIEQGN